MLNSYSQKFEAEQIFPIHDLDLNYAFNIQTGRMTGNIGVKYGPAGLMHYSQNLDVVIDPNYMLSEKYKKIGSKIKIGDFEATVAEILPDDYAMCDVVFKEATGKLLIDISAKWMMFRKLDAQGKVLGFNVTLRMHEVS